MERFRGTPRELTDLARELLVWARREDNKAPARQLRQIELVCLALIEQTLFIDLYDLAREIQ